MTPNNARIKKNHSKTVYNGRIVFLSIFRSCADLKSGMSTFCQSPKIYFESKNLFRIFFLKQARSLLSNAPRIIKIGSLSQFRHPLEFVDLIFRLQNSADLGTQDFPGFSESGSEIMDFLSQNSHFQTFLTLRVFNRFVIGWKF